MKYPLYDWLVTPVTKDLAAAAKEAGVETPRDFAFFQNHGYKVFTAGSTFLKSNESKKLDHARDWLDHLSSEELAANLFRATQAESKLRRDGVRGKDIANQVHYDVGREVRETIWKLGNVMPENLPPAEDLKIVKARLMEIQNQNAKAITNAKERNIKKKIK